MFNRSKPKEPKRTAQAPEASAPAAQTSRSTPQPSPRPGAPPPSESYMQKSRSKASAAVHAVGDGFTSAKHAVQNSVDAALEDKVDWILAKVGTRVSKMIVDPFMPEKLQAAIVRVWNSFWPDIAANVRNDIIAQHGLRNKQERKVTLDAWPPPPPPYTFTWLRAKMLYAVMPADIGFWQLLQRPSVYPVLLLLFFPFASVSTITWIVLLLFIDHNDEYQLANYILVFRAAIFISVGLYWSIKGFVLLYLCSTSVFTTCEESGPGVSNSQTLKIAMTIGRLACGWVAFVLLVRMRVKEERRGRSLTEVLSGTDEENPRKGKTPKPDQMKTSVTRYEQWAAFGCQWGLVLGFTLGLVGTVLLYLGFSFDGKPHQPTLTESLMPLSLLPSVNAIAGTVGGFTVALCYEHYVKGKERKEALKAIHEAEARKEALHEQKEKKMGRIASMSSKVAKRTRSMMKPKVLTTRGEARLEQSLLRAFNAVDVDDSGYLSKTEFQRALKLCGIEATDEEVEAVLQKHDKDNSGSLDWKEFRAFGMNLKHRFRVPAITTMTKLLLYEAVAFSTTVLLVVLNGYVSIGPESFWEVSPNFIAYCINVMLYGPAEPVVRETLFFGLALGSLISFLPFLIFKMPLIGPALLKLKPTGYDQAGNVRPVLTRAQKAAKAEMERKKEMESAGKSPRSLRTMSIARRKRDDSASKERASKERLTSLV